MYQSMIALGKLAYGTLISRLLYELQFDAANSAIISVLFTCSYKDESTLGTMNIFVISTAETQVSIV